MLQILGKEHHPMLLPEQNKLHKSFTLLFPNSWKFTSGQNKFYGKLLKRLIDMRITKTLMHWKVFESLLCQREENPPLPFGRIPNLTEPPNLCHSGWCSAKGGHLPANGRKGRRAFCRVSTLNTDRFWGGQLDHHGNTLGSNEAIPTLAQDLGTAIRSHESTSPAFNIFTINPKPNQMRTPVETITKKPQSHTSYVFPWYTFCATVCSSIHHTHWLSCLFPLDLPTPGQDTLAPSPWGCLVSLSHQL